MQRLKNKVAVVYGDGNIGGTIAKAFALEGAKVFLAGRTPSKLKEIADDIKSSAGEVETAIVDALNESAVEKHLNEAINKQGKVDISFNAIGIPLTELPLESFLFQSQLILNLILLLLAAARQMMKQSNGVILMHTPNASRISPPFVGGMVPAWSAMEALCRSLSVECGEKGVRSVCLLTTGISETSIIDEVWDIHGKAHGITFEQFNGVMESATHRKKLTTLAEFTNAAVFTASDEGSAISGTIFNLTAGMIVY